MSCGKDPAFPSLEFHEEFDDYTGRYREVPHMAGGLTKREYFAAMAMQALIGLVNLDLHDGPLHAQICRSALGCADHMIEALEKKQEPKS